MHNKQISNGYLLLNSVTRKFIYKVLQNFEEGLVYSMYATMRNPGGELPFGGSLALSALPFPVPMLLLEINVTRFCCV